jgi:hypothetical protein
MKRIINIFTLGLLVMALVAPGAALAQTSGAQGYGDTSEILPTIQDSGDDDGAGVQNATDNSGSLPFTGAELSVLAGAGSLLVLMGFGLRRFTHGPTRV